MQRVKIYKKKQFKPKYLKRYKQPNVLEGFTKRKIETLTAISIANGTPYYQFTSLGQSYVDYSSLLTANAEFLAQSTISKYYKITGVKVQFTPNFIPAVETLPPLMVANRIDHHASALAYQSNIGVDTLLTCQIGSGSSIRTKYWKHDSRLGVVGEGFCTNGLMESKASLVTAIQGGSIQLNNMNVGNATAQRNVGQLFITIYCNFYMNTGPPA